MKNIAIYAHSISASLSKVPVLHDISLALQQGRWTSIVGPNGAGKSTLLKVLAGLLPHTGTVTLRGKDMATMPARQRAQTLAWLGQGEAGADDLSVWDVALLGRIPHRPWLAAPSAADLAAVEQALRATQAWDWRARSLGQLSGGERQRVLLVRDLVERGHTVVSVLHELSIALQADDLLVLAQGRVRHAGAWSGWTWAYGSPETGSTSTVFR
jgi:iron complex transport system ATP-binding protein